MFALSLPLVFACAAPDAAVERPPRDPGADPDPADTDPSDTDSADTGPGPDASPQDISSTHLALDLAALSGRAIVQVLPAAGTGEVRLDVSGLQVTAVTVDGVAQEPVVRDGTLVVTAGADPVEVAVDYAFLARTPRTFDGWMPSLGVSFVWPYWCGNLWPCDPSLADGLVYTMEVSGVEDGLTAVYPRTTTGEGPAYMAAVTVGDYEKLDLGVTAAGTALATWYLANAQDDRAARLGTAHLVAVFDFLETTYGPYTFGPEYGSVEVNWGADSWGGMEHHPYSHIGSFDMDDEEVHAHEAVHGWFGDGVRIACWEDFVLSEGTTTYVTARALGEVGGPDLWPYYVDSFLVPVCDGFDVNTAVMPDTCGAIDFYTDDLWSLATYMKGACFYEEVADVIGPEVLDEVLGAFYREHVGGTAEMEDMIAAIEARAEPKDRAAVASLVTDWLLTEACPEDYARRCRERQAR